MQRILPIGVALLATVLLQDTVSGRRAGRRGPRKVRTHIVYKWEERVDRVAILHELHLYGNGFIRYSQRAGQGTPQETTLPSDPVFVDDLIKRYKTARVTKRVHPPCGAPQGGELSVQLTRRVRRYDLSEVALWSRYGRLARRMIARVVGAMPAPLEADCQPLKLRVDPSRVAEAPRKPAALPSRSEERTLLLRFGSASTPDEKLKLLARLAMIREGDRFFRWALLRRHAGSLPARRLVRRHASALVRGVRSRAEARELLGYLGLLQSAEGLFHRALLRQVLGEPDAAVRERMSFHRALNQNRAMESTRSALAKFRDAQVDANRRRPPWGRIRRSFARLFMGWLQLAEQVWAGDPAQAPPLAMWLYRRALHYARHSALGPSVRSSSGGPKVVRRARRLLRSHYPRLAAGRWDRHAYWHRKDLLDMTGYIRRFPRLFDKAWRAAHVENHATTVCRMIRLHYFTVAERYVTRMVEQGKSKEGPLRHAQGRCLLEAERWAGARKALAQAIGLGVPRARVTLVTGLLDQGDLEGADRELAAIKPRSAAAWRAASRLHRLRHRPLQAVSAAKQAYATGRDAASLVAVGRAWALAGDAARARKAWKKAIRMAHPSARDARVRLAQLALDRNEPQQALDAAWPLMQAKERHLRVAGHVLVAHAAAALGMEGLSRLQIERARYHAHEDPGALSTLAERLLEGGRGLAVALEAIRLAQGRRPGWSRLHAHRAFLYGQLRRLPEAIQAITAALIVRPDYPPYRAIERALVKLGGSRGL